MKILHLTLKKKWFDMIKSGEKKEEYREIKPYWIKRLIDNKTKNMKKYDVIHFKNGYAKNSPLVKIELIGIRMGAGLEEWGAEKLTYYFILKLGELI